MPSIEENLALWNKNYDWTSQGDEWSDFWGDAQTQWFGSIYPRIKSALPVETILEIAPGFGRWTQFLATQCQKLILVDLSETCINNCKERFSKCSHIEYHVNDGKSLNMVSDNSIDFIFSFDSLVHVEADVIENYIKECSKKLKNDGIGFIHHSNLGNYSNIKTEKSGIIDRIFSKLNNKPKIDNHWRGSNVTAEKFSKFCHENDLRCLMQETVNWGNSPEFLIDCFSMFCKKKSNWQNANLHKQNYNFMEEAKFLKFIFEHYRLSQK